MSAHTPGPLKLEIVEVHFEGSHYYQIGIPLGNLGGCEVVGNLSWGGENSREEFISRLVKNAPEMFELLKNLKPDLENLVVQRQYDWLIQPCAMINKLIQKIEGEV